jgi:predicted nucleic-acid-binding Zn-ribbon protein
MGTIESEHDSLSFEKSYRVSQAELDLLAYWISKNFADGIRALEGKEFIGLKYFLDQAALLVDHADLERFKNSGYLGWCEIRRKQIDTEVCYLCISNHLCTGCPEPNFDIRILRIEETQGSWAATGEGWQKIDNVEYRKESCPGCGGIYTEILQKIPILTKAFKCPSCGEEEKMTHAIKHLYLKEDQIHKLEFNFEVEIKCTKCKRKRILGQLLSGLLKALKIEIGLTGIKVTKN